jgi:hypothetical protein
MGLAARLHGTDRFEVVKGGQCSLLGRDRVDHLSALGEAGQNMRHDAGDGFGGDIHGPVGMAKRWNMEGRHHMWAAKNVLKTGLNKTESDYQKWGSVLDGSP